MMMYAIPAPQLVIASQDDDIQYCFSENINGEGPQDCYDTMEECENGRADYPGATDCEKWHRH
jgi:hypothetical protein